MSKEVKWIMIDDSYPSFNLWKIQCQNGNTYVESFRKNVDPNDILPRGHVYSDENSYIDIYKGLVDFRKASPYIIGLYDIDSEYENYFKPKKRGPRRALDVEEEEKDEDRDEMMDLLEDISKEFEQSFKRSKKYE